MPLATPTRRMPDAVQVKDLLSDLLGKDVSAEPTSDLDFTDDTLAAVTGLFVENSGELSGLCIADLAWASHSGAGLAMIPRPVAEESIASGVLEGEIRQNFHEVANILTTLLNGPSVAHLKITEVVDGVPPEARDFVVKAAGRRTFLCTLPEYGSGTLALYSR